MPMAHDQPCLPLAASTCTLTWRNQDLSKNCRRLSAIHHRQLSPVMLSIICESSDQRLHRLHGRSSVLTASTQPEYDIVGFLIDQTHLSHLVALLYSILFVGVYGVNQKEALPLGTPNTAEDVEAAVCEALEPCIQHRIDSLVSTAPGVGQSLVLLAVLDRVFCIISQRIASR